jgi:hypothetical protein
MRRCGQLMSPLYSVEWTYEYVISLDDFSHGRPMNALFIPLVGAVLAFYL